MNITHMTIKTTAIMTGTVLALSVALPAFALDVSTTVGVNARVGSTTVGAKATANLQTRIENGKSRAEQEITRRVTALNGLGSRIQDMKRVMSDQKSALAATLQSQITLMTTLQTKITADTDLDTLKADIKSITESYRIYMLVLPQASISAAADRIQTTASTMTSLSTKLSARITAAQSAGKNVTTLQTNLTDMNAKIADANTQATTAISETIGLKPDNGDATVKASNTAALKDARSKLQAARTDMVTARKDAGTIVKALQSMHLNTTASTSATVTQ